MNLRAAPPEIRLIVALTATAVVAACALMPRRSRMGFAEVQAGIPFRYASWRGTSQGEFNVWALTADVALLMAVAGFFIWRYWANKRDAEFRQNSEDVLSVIRLEHELQRSREGAAQPPIGDSAGDREKRR